MEPSPCGAQTTSLVSWFEKPPTPRHPPDHRFLVPVQFVCFRFFFRAMIVMVVKERATRKHGLVVSTTEQGAVLAVGTSKSTWWKEWGQHIYSINTCPRGLYLPPFPCKPKTVFFVVHPEHRRSIETANLLRSLNPPNCHTTTRHCTTTMDCFATPSKTFA